MPLSDEEEKILASIHVASENNPELPEFPPDKPRFPATPTYKINVPGFSNVWLKDESVNPTGTHKDRMAWEMVVTYRDILLAKKRGQVKGPLPQMSLISSGSAAVAVQTMLTKYHLPALKVLIDKNTNKQTVKRLKGLGCEVYKIDLGEKALRWREILRLTDNPKGIDITSDDSLGPTTRFYDWMSYEIINSSPDYCFIPFGTGNLYENILNINKQEVSSRRHDPRLSGNIEKLRQCNFVGATTHNSKSKADKLYSPFLPFAHADEQQIHYFAASGFCGPESGVFELEENFLDEALALTAKQKIDCEPSGIAGLAMLLQMQNKVPKDAKILIVNTGKTKF